MSTPLRVCVVGALGRMGERVRAEIAAEEDLVVGAALESAGHPRLGERLEGGVVLGADAKAAVAASDVVIDFSVPASTLALLPIAVDAGVACVIGTTGFSDGERTAIASAGKRIGIVLAPNFSVAVNVLTHLVREAARLLGPGFDAEIVELHHAAKRDAPSGTALRLAAAIAEERGGTAGAELASGRVGDTGPRAPGTIGIQALRGGDNPGEHTVLFVGAGERLELAHRAMTRHHFVKGALRAARWLRGRAPGLYAMEDVLGLRP